MMTTTRAISVSSRTDGEGCVIVTARRGHDTCHYDGDDYTGPAAGDEDLRYAARRAYDAQTQGAR